MLNTVRAESCVATEAVLLVCVILCVFLPDVWFQFSVFCFPFIFGLSNSYCLSDASCEFYNNNCMTLRSSSPYYIVCNVKCVPICIGICASQHSPYSFKLKKLLLCKCKCLALRIRFYVCIFYK